VVNNRGRRVDARPVCEFGQVLAFEGKIELDGFSVLRVGGFYWWM
jgi:hypothetical protein